MTFLVLPSHQAARPFWRDKNDVEVGSRTEGLVVQERRIDRGRHHQSDSMLGDGAAGAFPGATPTGVGVLMLMHVVAAAVIVWFLTVRGVRGGRPESVTPDAG